MKKNDLLRNKFLAGIITEFQYKNKQKEAEEWFLGILKDLKVKHIKTDVLEYQNSKGEWMIKDSKDGITWFSQDRIWNVLDERFGMKYDDIQKFLKDQVLTYLRLKVTTAQYPESFV